MKYFLTILVTCTLGIGVLQALPAQAQDIGLQYGAQSGLKATDPRLTVARIINILLSLLGMITVIIIVYAGFLWMTGGGNQEQVTKAKGMLSAAVIGLFIIFTAWSISTFVLKRLYKATAGTAYPYASTDVGP